MYGCTSRIRNIHRLLGPSSSQYQGKIHTSMSACLVLESSIHKVLLMGKFHIDRYLKWSRILLDRIRCILSVRHLGRSSVRTKCNHLLESKFRYQLECIRYRLCYWCLQGNRNRNLRQCKHLLHLLLLCNHSKFRQLQQFHLVQEFYLHKLRMSFRQYLGQYNQYSCCNHHFLEGFDLGDKYHLRRSCQ